MRGQAVEVVVVVRIEIASLQVVLVDDLRSLRVWSLQQLSVVFNEIDDKLSLGDAGQEVVADAREDVHHLVHLRSSLSVLLLPSRARIHEEEGEVLGLYAGIASVCDDAAVDGLEPV